MAFEFMEDVYEDILNLLDELVIKRGDLARAAETSSSYSNFERYLACINGRAQFYDFNSYDVDILEQFMSHDEAMKCHESIALIPEEIRSSVAKLQSERFNANYVETNNYYRMLMGLPNYEDTDYVYAIDQVTGKRMTTPVHELSVDQISRLEISGQLARIIEENPTKEYLRYLGVNAIDHITARCSRSFDILRLGTCSNVRTEQAFRTEYVFARRYVLASSYHPEHFYDKELYDPTVGIMILGLAIRNTLALNEKRYLDYDEMINRIFQSYGLRRYFERFPFTYKRKLALALDTLLASKGTDKVLVDVCKIFGADELIANRYYIIKWQKHDEDGHVVVTGDPKQDYDISFIKAPIENRDIDTSEENRISYDSVTNSDYLWQLTDEEYEKLLESNYNLIMTKYVDVEAAYDVTKLVFEICCFTNLITYARDNLAKEIVVNKYSRSGRSSIHTMLIFMLSAMARRANFDGNVIYDPVDIDELRRHYATPDVDLAPNTTGRDFEPERYWAFNYKGRDIWFDYYVANEGGSSTTEIDLSSMVKGEEYGLPEEDYKYDENTDAVVYVIGSTMLEEGIHYSIDGNTLILINGWSLGPGEKLIRRTMRHFDIQTLIKDIIDKYNLHTDVVDALIEGYDSIDLAAPAGYMNPMKVLNTYIRNKNLYDAIAREANSTHNIHHYQALDELRDVLYTSSAIRDSFSKSDHTIADTYEDLLEDLDPSLVLAINMASEDTDSLNHLLLYIMETLDTVFSGDALQYLFLGMPDSYTKLVRNYITQAIDVFKASSVQLQSINVMFNLGEGSPIRILDEETHSKERHLNDYIHIEDAVGIRKTIICEDWIRVGDKVYTNIN